MHEIKILFFKLKNENFMYKKKDDVNFNKKNLLSLFLNLTFYESCLYVSVVLCNFSMQIQHDSLFFVGNFVFFCVSVNRWLFCCLRKF